MFLKRFFEDAGPAYVNAVAQAGTIGLHLVSGIAVGGVMGFFIDRWLDSAPYGLLIMGALGIVAGFKMVYTDSKRLIASQQREEEQKNGRGNPPEN